MPNLELNRWLYLWLPALCVYYFHKYRFTGPAKALRKVTLSGVAFSLCPFRLTVLNAVHTNPLLLMRANYPERRCALLRVAANRKMMGTGSSNCDDPGELGIYTGMDDSGQFDAIIIGGGPAGATRGYCWRGRGSKR